MRALAINRRSMVAIRRPNRVGVGTRPKAAVLDISIPFCGSADQIVVHNLGIPDARSNAFVCIAAYHLLQCSITASKFEAVPPGNIPKQKARRKPGGLGRGFET